MKKIFSGGFLFFILYAFTFSQNQVDFNHYVPLKCQGPIPADFKAELSKLVEQAKREGSVGKADKKHEVEFAELSNYQLNNILFSGKVLYGDRLTEYVNKVADVVLKNDVKLRKKLRFYVLKNTDLNAYSTQSGVIFVSMGLLAQIENEAQLAFIICHEVIHFKNNHNLESYKKRQEITSSRGPVNVYDRLTSILNYSKEHELEADREGLELFLKTPYNTNDLNNLFDVMLYSYLPFDEIPLDSQYFNSGAKYILPGKYFLKKVADITAEEDVSDSLNTHPNIKRRREAIRKILVTKHNAEGSSFVVSEDEFNIVQHAARCEIAVVYLQNAEFEDAFYCGYLMEKIYGKDLFSKKIICSSLYGLAQERNSDEEDGGRIGRSSSRTYDEKKEWEKIEGESQAIYYLVYKMQSKELNILAARQLLEGYHIYKDDFFAIRLKSLIDELVNEYDLQKSFFLDEPAPVSAKDTVQKVQKDTMPENTKLSKIDKIRKSKSEKSSAVELVKDGEYFRYAFAAYFQDTIWREEFIRAGERKEKDELVSSSPEYYRYKAEKRRVIRKYGQGLNLDKFIMLNPFYSSYILKRAYYMTYTVKNPNVSPLQEIAIEQELAGYFMEYAKKLDLNVDLVGMSQQSDIETEQFNDYQQIINWFSERIAAGKLGTCTYNDQFMEKYADEYGYLGFCYVVNVNKSLELVFILVDIRTGKAKLVYEKNMRKAKADGMYTRMMVYDILHQVKQEGDKIEKLKKKYGIRE
jgi:Zn-dependent protease with chaperone function